MNQFKDLLSGHQYNVPAAGTDPIYTNEHSIFFILDLQFLYTLLYQPVIDLIFRMAC